MPRAKSNNFLPVASLVMSVVAVAISSLSLWETHVQNKRLLSASVDFLTQFDKREKTVGIAVLNTGPAPAKLDVVRFYVDGREVSDSDEAAKTGKLDPELLTDLDMKGSTLGVGETVWLFSRATKDKRDLDKFVEFVDARVAIYVRWCSLSGKCAEKCSADDAGLCRMAPGRKTGI